MELCTSLTLCFNPSDILLQTLRVPLVRRLARSLRAASRAHPTRTSTLPIQGRTSSATGRGRPTRRRGWGTTVVAAAVAELALDECESLLAVLAAVLLVRVGVVACAAVWVRRVAVALHLGAGVGRADVAAGAGGEL